MVHLHWNSRRLRLLLTYGVRAGSVHTTIIELMTLGLFKDCSSHAQTRDAHCFRDMQGRCNSKVTTRVGPMRVSLNTSRRVSQRLNPHGNVQYHLTPYGPSPVA